MSAKHKSKSEIIYILLIFFAINICITHKQIHAYTIENLV